MTYVKQTWANGSAGSTPINADRLNYIETGLERATSKVYYAEDYATFDGLTDITTALQSLHDLAPVGSTIILPPRQGVISSLTLTKDLVWQGSDWNVTSYGYPFGASGWATRIQGSVLRSTITSGVAINVNLSSISHVTLRDLAIVGPGSGTTIGIQYGGITAAYGSKWGNVAVANFATGMVWDFAIDCQTNKMVFAGCQKAWRFQTNCNQSVLINTQIDTCVNGLDVTGSTILTFMGGVIQGGTGSGRAIRTENSYGCSWDSFYLENANGLYGIDLDSGGNNLFRNIHLGTAGKDIVRVNCSGNVFEFFQQSQDLTYTASGNSNLIHSPWAATITDGGTGNTLIKDGPLGQIWGGTAPTYSAGLNVGTNGEITFRSPGATQLILKSILTLLFGSGGANNVELQTTGGTGIMGLYGAGGINLRNQVQIQGDNAGAIFYSGSGVPAMTATNGSFYFRTDGGAGSCIYQRRAGAWVATAA